MGRWHQAEISAGLKKGAVVTARRGEKAATGARGLEKELREGPREVQSGAGLIHMET